VGANAQGHQHITRHKHEPDYDQLRPFFGWSATDLIKKTFEHTTKYARLPAQEGLQVT
jgi:hypothetical protein